MQDEVAFVWTGHTIPSRANTLSCQLGCDEWWITVAGLLLSVTAAAFMARENQAEKLAWSSSVLKLLLQPFQGKSLWQKAFTFIN